MHLRVYVCVLKSVSGCVWRGLASPSQCCSDGNTSTQTHTHVHTQVQRQTHSTDTRTQRYTTYTEARTHSAHTGGQDVKRPTSQGRTCDWAQCLPVRGPVWKSGVACLSCVCSACVRLCSHHHHPPADTKFPILSQQREWKEGKRQRPEGGGQGRSWLLCPGASFQPRSGARPAARGRDRTALGRRQRGRQGRGAWVLSSHLARGSPSGSLPQLRLPA